MDTVSRRLELLKLEGLGFSQAEIVKELSAKKNEAITEQLRKKDQETKALRETIGTLGSQIAQLQSERLNLLPEEVKAWRRIVDKIKKVHPEWVVEE